MHRLIFILLILLAQNTYAQKTDLERLHILGNVKVYHQVKKQIMHITGDNYRATTDSTFSYYNSKGMLTEFVGYGTEMSVNGKDTTKKETRYYNSKRQWISRLVQKDVNYTYHPSTGDTLWGGTTYHSDENDNVMSIVTWYSLSDGKKMAETETIRYLPNGKRDTLTGWADNDKGMPEVIHTQKWSYGLLTDTAVMRYENNRMLKRITEYASPGVKQYVTIYDGKGRVVSGECFMYAGDDTKEPVHKGVGKDGSYPENKYEHTTFWMQDKQGNYLRRATYGEHTLNEERWEIEYYK